MPFNTGNDLLSHNTLVFSFWSSFHHHQPKVLCHQIHWRSRKVGSSGLNETTFSCIMIDFAMCNLPIISWIDHARKFTQSLIIRWSLIEGSRTNQLIAFLISFSLFCIGLFSTWSMYCSSARRKILSEKLFSFRYILMYVLCEYICICTYMCI